MDEWKKHGEERLYLESLSLESGEIVVVMLVKVVGLEISRGGGD